MRREKIQERNYVTQFTALANTISDARAQGRTGKRLGWGLADVLAAVEPALHKYAKESFGR